MATFTLTDQRDTITATSGDDTITGGTAALQTDDTIDGAGGFDTLESGTDPNGTQAPTITGVERIMLDTAGLPFSIASVSGAERITTMGASIVIEEVERDDLAIQFGARNVESGTVDLRFVDGALESGTDRVRLLSDSSNVTFTSGSVFDSPGGPVNQTEDAKRIEFVALEVRGSDNQVDISDFTAIKVVTISGDAPVVLSVDSTALEIINANATSGGVTVTSDIAGDQSVLGGSGSDDVKTGGGDDALYGREGDDVLNAGGGDNFVLGGAGNDEVLSEGGDDRITLGAGDDRVDSGSGNDRIVAGDGADDIRAGGGDDIVNAGAGDDTARAGGGNDYLFDGDGNDTMFGQGGDDRFIAGAGDDTFTGGGGVDRYLFDRNAFDTDTVTDFTLTSDTRTNDVVVFDYLGERQTLRSQSSFQEFDSENPDAFTVDDATSTITINADGGTIILEVSDTDFFMS